MKYVDEPEPPLDEAIRTLLFESIREMLFNVVKHAQVNDATVTVRHDHDAMHVTVSDEGVGFDVQAKARQESKSDFGVFSRGDRIEAMGGSWSIDTAPGQGTRVHVELPLDTPPVDESADGPGEAAAPASPRVSSSGAAGRVRVLVVDDHALVRSGIATILRQNPRVTVIGEAGDGMEAVAAVEQHQPDVVLMDVNMPRTDGIKATREIHRRYPNTIVIGLSMQGKDGDAARAMSDAGAAAFLSKSDDAGQMVDTILHLIKSTSSR